MFSLVFADGPTPKDPTEARTVGWDTCAVGRRMDQEVGSFSIYVHRCSFAECIAYVRAVGRDCTFLSFSATQVLLRVTEERT